jgi:hypothetical protein
MSGGTGRVSRALLGPVRPAGLGWAAAGVVAILTVTELTVIPALSRSTLPGAVQVGVLLVAGTALRAALGAFVAWRMQRAGSDGDRVIARTVACGVLAGLVLVWVASVAVVRPWWELAEWVAELGRVMLSVVLWLPPPVVGALWFARAARG